MTEASAANSTFEDILVCDVFSVDIQSQQSILPVRIGRGTGYYFLD